MFSCATAAVDRSNIFQNLCSPLVVLCPRLSTPSLPRLFCSKRGLIYSISSIFICKIAPYFCGNHFILCMLKGLLSPANIFLIKATLNGWAIARGKMHGWWRTKVTSEQQINYSLRKGAAIKDKVRPEVTHSFSDCVIYLCYDTVKAICWDLNTAISASNTTTREMMYCTDLRLNCKCKLLLSGKENGEHDKRSPACSIWFK